MRGAGRLLVMIVLGGCSERHASTLAADAGSALTLDQAKPERDGGPRTAAIGCDVEGHHYVFGERFTIASEERTCECDPTGVECHSYCCSADVTKCDGGPCTTCTMGMQTFPVGASVTCDDGCNECTCDPYGGWLQTLVGCVTEPAELQPCSPPTAAAQAASASLVFIDPSAFSKVELRTRFARGGCELYPPDVRGCYRLDADHVAQLWMEPLSSLADCEVPFIVERVFHLNALRQEIVGIAPDRASVIAVGQEKFSVAF